MRYLSRPARLIGLLLLACSLTACDSVESGASEDGTPVTLRFALADTEASKALAAGQDLGKRSTAHGLTVTGSNGSLQIEGLQFIVEEFELEQDGDACEARQATACGDFEAPSQFVTLPLDGSGVTVATDDLPDGRYTELDFEVGDLDLDEDDAEPSSLDALIREVRAAHPDWPEDASLIVTGTFTPNGGEARPFRVFAEAEIEVEITLAPALVIEAGVASRTLTVLVDPGAWFLRSDGQVRDLSAHDYATSGDLLELEVEIEDGFRSVEWDDD